MLVVLKGITYKYTKINNIRYFIYRLVTTTSISFHGIVYEERALWIACGLHHLTHKMFILL